jgi:hypothetical protein
MDVRNLPMGNYWVKVHAHDKGAWAPDDEDTFGPIMVGNSGVFIKLT